MIIIVLMIDALGYNYLSKDSFWYKYSQMITNDIPTITCPNWITILTGKKCTEHKILNNEDIGRNNFIFPHTTIFSDYPNYTKYFISDWHPLRKTVQHDVTFVHTRKVWTALHKLLKYSIAPNTLIILNTDRLDTVAHINHWGSKQYYNTLQKIDNHTHAINCKLAKLNKKYVLFGIADHGGHKDDHEDHTNPLIRQVPLLTISNVPVGKFSINTNDQFRRHIKKIVNKNTKIIKKKIIKHKT